MKIGKTEILRIPQSENGRKYADKIVNQNADMGRWVKREDTSIMIEVTITYQMEVDNGDD